MHSVLLLRTIHLRKFNVCDHPLPHSNNKIIFRSLLLRFMTFIHLSFIYLYFAHLILYADNPYLHHFLLLMYVYFYYRERIEILINISYTRQKANPLPEIIAQQHYKKDWCRHSAKIKRWVKTFDDQKYQIFFFISLLTKALVIHFTNVTITTNQQPY